MQFTHNANKTIGMTSIAEELLNVTQQAAIAAYPLIGKCDKLSADDAGTKAMRYHLNNVEMCGRIVIGEGEMDEAPMLYINEEVGSGSGLDVDIAVDPIEGTNLMATGKDNSLAVLAAARRGCLLHAPDMYMKKIAVGPEAKGKINLDAPLLDNMKAVAKAQGKDIRELTIMIQERDRHKDLINEVLLAGAKLKLFSDVDITGAIGAAMDDIDIDMLVGTGGAPEGVVTAVALKCLGGDFQAQLVPMNKMEYNRCRGMGIEDPYKLLGIDDIVQGDDILFSATGITDGLFLNGVRERKNGNMYTHSLLLVGAGARRFQLIEGFHR